MSTKPLARQVVPGARGAESASAEDGAVRTRDSLFHWCGTVDAIHLATKESDKHALLEAYFSAVAKETVAPAARFFTGSFFAEGETARVESTVVAEAIQALARMNADDLNARHKETGDLGAVAAEAFAGRLPSGMAVADVAAWAAELAPVAGTPGERAVIHELLARVSSLEARYLVNLMIGKLDIGVGVADVEASVAARLAGPAAQRPADRRKQDVPRSGGADEPQRRRRRAS